MLGGTGVLLPLRAVSGCLGAAKAETAWPPKPEITVWLFTEQAVPLAPEDSDEGFSPGSGGSGAWLWRTRAVWPRLPLPPLSVSFFTCKMEATLGLSHSGCFSESKGKGWGRGSAGRPSSRVAAAQGVFPELGGCGCHRHAGTEGGGRGAGRRSLPACRPSPSTHRSLSAFSCSGSGTGPRRPRNRGA